MIKTFLILFAMNRSALSLTASVCQTVGFLSTAFYSIICRTFHPLILAEGDLAVRQEFQVSLDVPVPQDQLVLRVYQETMAPKDPRVQSVHQETMAVQGPKALPALKAPRVPRALQGP